MTKETTIFWTDCFRTLQAKWSFAESEKSHDFSGVGYWYLFLNNSSQKSFRTIIFYGCDRREGVNREAFSLMAEWMFQDVTAKKRATNLSIYATWSTWNILSSVTATPGTAVLTRRCSSSARPCSCTYLLPASPRRPPKSPRHPPPHSWVTPSPLTLRPALCAKRWEAFGDKSLTLCQPCFNSRWRRFFVRPIITLAVKQLLLGALCPARWWAPQYTAVNSIRHAFESSFSLSVACAMITF